MWRSEPAFGKGPRRERIPPAAVAVACALGLAVNLWVGVLNRPGWGVDFNQFYAAGRLAGTGHLYDWDALRKIEAEHGVEVPTGRLPVVLYGYKILGVFPYAAARAIWMVLGIAALIVFAVAWPGTRPLPMISALAWSLSATLVLLFGQDVPFWLMFFAAGLLLIDRKKPWSAGLMFSLCICKFHLALGIPIMLVARKCWKTLAGGAVGVLLLVACCFQIEGPGWPLEYLKMARMPAFSPAPERMPNLYGVASWSPWPMGTQAVSAVAVVLLLWVVCRRGGEIGMAGAAAATCGLLVGPHAYAGDYTLLIPLSVLTIQREGAPGWLKAWAIAMLTPASVLLLVSGTALPAQLLIAAFVVTAVWAGREKPGGLPVPHEDPSAADRRG